MIIKFPCPYFILDIDCPSTETKVISTRMEGDIPFFDIHTEDPVEVEQPEPVLSGPRPADLPSPVARGTGMLRAGGSGGQGLHTSATPPSVRGGVPIITPGSPGRRGRGLLRVAGAGAGTTRSPHRAAPNPSDQGHSSSTDSMNLNLNVVAGSGEGLGVVHAVGAKEDRAVDLENMDVDINEYLQSTKNRNTKSGETQFIRHFNDTFDTLNKQKKAEEEPYKHFEDCSNSNELANQMCKFLILCRKKVINFELSTKFCQHFHCI